MEASPVCSRRTERHSRTGNTRQFHELAKLKHRVNGHVVHSGVTINNPAVNPMSSIEQSLHSIVFRNDYWTVKILSHSRSVTARQFCELIDRPMFPPRSDLMPL